MDVSLSKLIIITNHISQYAWGIPSIVLLVGTGLYLTIRLRFLQIRYFWRACGFLFKKQPQKVGETSPFQALCAALSGTIGTGNIAGVATAIALGGPGAVFWMWVTAIVGMVTKFSSCMLAVKYREVDKNGHVSGGPMYTLKKGLNAPKLGAFYALFTIIASFGIGNTVQANSIMGGLGFLFPPIAQYDWLIGLILAMLVGVVIIGGIHRIAQTATFIVPFMAFFYVSATLVILILHIKLLPHAFFLIFNLALNPHAAGAGALGMALRYGVARGVFSNEAGLGSAAIVHATARTNAPMTQGLVAMLGPFIDTIVVCTMTALVIIVTNAWGGPAAEGLTGAALSAYAFNHGLQPLGASNLGALIVGIGLVFFAYTSIITWSYYGDRCVQYLVGDKFLLAYRLLFILMLIVGAVIPLHLVWNLADIANIFMALPNLLSLILLAGILKKEITNLSLT